MIARLKDVAASGCSITVTADRKLVVRPSALLFDEHREELKRRRDAVIAALEKTRDRVRRAVTRCCDLRGDDTANRLALLQECSALDHAQQVDMAEHFEAEAARWAAATGAVQ